VPAYVIFHDATLQAIAELKPASIDELAAVGGIGAKKLDRYGWDVLRVVREEA
jgi:ATP-dependent DNA helicase RecQ